MKLARRIKHLGLAHRVSPIGTVATLIPGSILLIGSGYLHFRLWNSFGYRHIPNIGPLFLVQAASALLLGVVVLLVRRVGVALLGAGFSVATALGLYSSIHFGLFGFRDSWSAPFAHETFALELVSALLLSLGVVFGRVRSTRSSKIAPVTRAFTRALD